MPFVLYIVNVKGEQDYGRLEFERKNCIEEVIARELEKPNDRRLTSESEDSSSSSESSPAYYCGVYTFSFSTKNDRDNAIFIFGEVHDYIDYDHSKTSDIFYMTQEEYLDEISKRGIWLVLEGKEWAKLPANQAKLLEKYYIEFNPETDTDLYYEFSNVSFDFNTMTFVTRTNKKESWDVLWASKNVRKIKRVC